jgi:3-hydroxyacyl-CoA dehydrogenase
MTKTLDKIGVIGAGTMGNGIAQVSAAAGLQVVMIDVSDAAVQRGMAAVGTSLDRLVKKEKLRQHPVFGPGNRGSGHRSSDRESRCQTAHHEAGR